MNFECPSCDGPAIEKLDDRLFGFDMERIQGSDDLDADPLVNITNKIELWDCCFCGGYFRVYYSLEKIVSLKEDFTVSGKIRPTIT